MIESPVAYAVAIDGCAHEWANEYYGSRCTKCNLFYADGNAPWDYVDEAAIEREEAIYNYKAPCEVCGGEFWDGGTSCRCDQPPVILGLDASSTTIGFCILDGTTVRDFGEVRLHHSDIAERCRLAWAALNTILEVCEQRGLRPDLVALESPVCRYAKSVIPQARVSGALLALCALQGLLVVEVTPGQGKLALAQRGDAGKVEMQDAALGYGVRGEHAADALGVALFGLGRVEVSRP